MAKSVLGILGGSGLYDLPGLGNANLGYVLSAVLGVAVTAVVVWLFVMLLTAGTRPQAHKQAK